MGLSDGAGVSDDILEQLRMGDGLLEVGQTCLPERNPGILPAPHPNSL